MKLIQLVDDTLKSSVNQSCVKFYRMHLYLLNRCNLTLHCVRKHDFYVFKAYLTSMIVPLLIYILSKLYCINSVQN